MTILIHCFYVIYELYNVQYIKVVNLCDCILSNHHYRLIKESLNEPFQSNRLPIYRMDKKYVRYLQRL